MSGSVPGKKTALITQEWWALHEKEKVNGEETKRALKKKTLKRDRMFNNQGKKPGKTEKGTAIQRRENLGGKKKKKKKLDNQYPAHPKRCPNHLQL